MIEMILLLLRLIFLKDPTENITFANKLLGSTVRHYYQYFNTYIKISLQ